MASAQIPLYTSGSQPDGVGVGVGVGVELQPHSDAHGVSYYIHQAHYDERYGNDAKDVAKNHMVA